MNRDLQAIVQNIAEDNASNDQTIIFGGALLFVNLFVMLFVGLYWMNPVMHQFISGKPLL